MAGQGIWANPFSLFLVLILLLIAEDEMEQKAVVNLGTISLDRSNAAEPDKTAAEENFAIVEQEEDPVSGLAEVEQLPEMIAAPVADDELTIEPEVAAEAERVKDEGIQNWFKQLTGKGWQQKQQPRQLSISLNRRKLENY